MDSSSNRPHDLRECGTLEAFLDSTNTGPSLLAEAMREGRVLTAPSGSDRAPRAFCGIGVCMECETEIEGRIVRACLVEGSR